MLNEISLRNDESRKIMIEELIKIEVAYATSQRQVIIPLQISSTATIKQAIEQSGILKQFPEINLQINKVGIFGEIVQLNHLLHSGDRVEIYRPLTMDPKLARRLRAEKQKKRKI